MTTPISNLTATWATSGSTVNTAIGMDVNAVSYSALSKILNLKINSNSVFSVDSTGSTALGNRSFAPSPAAIIDFWAKDRGVLFPRMTTTERDTISSPPNGLVIYNESLEFLQVRRAGMWSNVGEAGPAGPELPSTDIANTVFVTATGNDSNSGSSELNAVATIERALQIASGRGTTTLIKVGPGVYETEGHLDLPDNTIIQATHRTVFIRPKAGFEVRNVFRMGSGCFIEGLVIENFRVDSLTNPTEGCAFRCRPGAVINAS